VKNKLKRDCAFIFCILEVLFRIAPVELFSFGNGARFWRDRSQWFERYYISLDSISWVWISSQ
jgi:hypothetical protein